MAVLDCAREVIGTASAAGHALHADQPVAALYVNNAHPRLGPTYIPLAASQGVVGIKRRRDKTRWITW